MLRKTEALGSALRQPGWRRGRSFSGRLAVGARALAALASMAKVTEYGCWRRNADAVKATLCRLSDWLQDTVLADAALPLPASVTACARMSAPAGSREAFFRRPVQHRRRDQEAFQYAEKLEMVGGNNRDRENLPQVNLNMVHARLVNLLYTTGSSMAASRRSAIVNTAAFRRNWGLRAASLTRFQRFHFFYFHDLA